RNRYASEIDVRHVGIAVAGGRERLFEPLELTGRQLEASGSCVLFEVLAPLGAGNRDDIVAAGVDPRERDLTRSHASLVGDFAHTIDELEVPLEVAGLEARVVAPEVVRLQVVE